MKQSATPQKKIKKILQQDNYKVEKGKLYRRYPNFGWGELGASCGQIALVPTDDIPELFLWSDVEQVILSMEGDKGNGVIREKTKVKKS